MFPETRPLDHTRWAELWCRLGARGSGGLIFDRLSAAYKEPCRAYHTTEHLATCLAELDGNRDLAGHPDEVEAALWFHDAVYVPGASDNEEQSARLAESVLSGNGVPADVSKRIAELVLATRHLAASPDIDSQLVCDIDLSILGSDSHDFDRFERQIRREYLSVPEPLYRSARSQVLAGFLRRPSIYQTRRFADRYEARARENLSRALAGLSQ